MNDKSNSIVADNDNMLNKDGLSINKSNSETQVATDHRGGMT